MFSIVIVSHSEKLAEGVVEVAKMMARDVTIVAAGGTEDGSLGTSYEKIAAAIDKAYTDDGVALFMDMGSASNSSTPRSSRASSSLPSKLLQEPRSKTWQERCSRRAICTRSRYREESFSK